MNDYDNKNDKIRWWYRYRIEKLMAKSEKDKICLHNLKNYKLNIIYNQISGKILS